MAMTNLYKYDKASCAKNLAAKVEVSVTYCNQSQEVRKSEAAKRNMRRKNQSANDLTSQYGPPDRECHFLNNGGKKRKTLGTCNRNENAKRPKVVAAVSEMSDEDSDIDVFTQSSFHQPNSKYLGHKLQMKFKIENTEKYEMFNGQIIHFDPKSGKCGVFFPSDGQMVYINPSQEGDDIVFYK